jgi:hypothetical protein
MRFRFAHDIFKHSDIRFRRHARAEKKCAASPGGTFFILLPAPTLSTTRPNAAFFIGRRLNYAARADSKGKPVGS